MKKPSKIELFCHEASYPLSGEYTNSVMAKRKAKDEFKVWVSCRNVDGDEEHVSHDDLRTPESFVWACEQCFDSGVDFGEPGIGDIFHTVVPRLRQLDSDFAEEVRKFLIEKYPDQEF